VRLRTRKLAVFATCLGIGGAIPVMSSADQGGVPNIHSQNKPCKAKGKGAKKPAPNTKGKKCGFNKGTTTTLAPSTSSTATDTSTSTTTTTTATP
jgi:hypothetical protein